MSKYAREDKPLLFEKFMSNRPNKYFRDPYWYENLWQWWNRYELIQRSLCRKLVYVDGLYRQATRQAKAVMEIHNAAADGRPTVKTRNTIKPQNNK